MTEILVDFMTGKGILFVYAILFVAAFLEYAFPPFPSDATLLFASFLAGEGLLNPFIIFVLTMIGSIFGSICIYELGRTKGRGFFEKRDLPFFPRKRITKLEEWFERHGGKILIVNRFFSGFRAAFFLAAGIGRMPIHRVIAYGALSSAIWTLLIIAAGYTVGANWTVLRDYLSMYSAAIVAIVALVFVVAFLRYRLRQRRSEKTPQSPSPF